MSLPRATGSITSPPPTPADRRRSGAWVTRITSFDPRNWGIGRAASSACERPRGCTGAGEGVSVMMSLNENKKMPFPALPAAARVVAIIAQYALYGMIPLVIPELFPAVTPPTQQIEYQSGSDLDYIEQLAKKNG